MGGIVAGVGGLLGGVAGSQKSKTNTSGSSAQQSQVFAEEASAEEKQARDLALNSLTSLDKRLSALESSPTLSRLDSLLAELGGPPTAERIQQANETASNLFQGRRVALDQSLEDQTTAFAQRAAQMGRSSADPILAAKLAQESVRQRAALDAEEGAFAAGEAINAPARQFNSVLGGLTGLSAQAIQNRQAVYSLGSDFANSLQQYRLATATRTGGSQFTQDAYSGGGFRGALTGVLGGAAAGVGIGQAAGLFGGGGGGVSGIGGGGIGSTLFA